MRFQQIVSAFLLAALSGTALAGTVTFCTDDNCSENCGIAHDMDGTNCIEGGPAGSVKASESTGASLVLSPHPGCTCQSNCMSSKPGGVLSTLNAGCNKLPGTYMSMRFISQGCAKNNC